MPAPQSLDRPRRYGTAQPAGTRCSSARVSGRHPIADLGHGIDVAAGHMITWPRGVTVSTLESESSDRCSNPREALLQWRMPTNESPHARVAFQPAFLYSVKCANHAACGIGGFVVLQMRVSKYM